MTNPTISYQNNELSCNLYPLRLHDTYAVDFTVFFKDKILKLSELPSLNPNGCLLPAAIQASLGQTLLFYAEPVVGVIPDKTLADQYLQALWQQTELPKFAVKEGRLFGSPLFEYEEVSDIAAARATHVLVWFGTHAQTVDLATKTNNYFIKLLCQRHKILYVSQVARQNYQEARSLYRQLVSEIRQFNALPKKPRERLEKLEELLKAMPADTAKYTQQIGNLDDHKTTLLANVENYGQSLAALFESRLPEDQIDFWQDFRNSSNQKRQQIDIDLAYLTPGQALFQQLTTNIQGLSQVETLKHEFTQQERLERIIVSIASTLESAAISAKVDYEHHFVQNLLGSGYYEMLTYFLGIHITQIVGHLLVGIPFGIVAFLILWLMQKVINRLP